MFTGDGQPYLTLRARTSRFIPENPTCALNLAGWPGTNLYIARWGG
jgi:hypothetical protein